MSVENVPDLSAEEAPKFTDISRSFTPCQARRVWYVRTGVYSDCSGVSIVPVTLRAHDRAARMSIIDIHPAPGSRFAARHAITWDRLFSEIPKATECAVRLLHEIRLECMPEPSAPAPTQAPASIRWETPPATGAGFLSVQNPPAR